MPNQNTINDFEQQIEREAEAIIESLIRKAQEKIAAAAQPKTDAVDESTMFDQMVAYCLLDPLNWYELSMIKALIFYLSRTQRFSEKALHGLLEAKFHAANIESIRRQDYPLAAQCLIDLQKSGGMN